MATTEPTASAAYHASLETLLRLATVAKDRALRYARRESTIDHYHDAIDVSTALTSALWRRGDLRLLRVPRHGRKECGHHLARSAAGALLTLAIRAGSASVFSMPAPPAYAAPIYCEPLALRLDIW